MDSLVNWIGICKDETTLSLEYLKKERPEMKAVIGFLSNKVKVDWSIHEGEVETPEAADTGIWSNLRDSVY